jgi:hypothetical protein
MEARWTCCSGAHPVALSGRCKKTCTGRPPRGKRDGARENIHWVVCRRFRINVVPVLVKVRVRVRLSITVLAPSLITAIMLGQLVQKQWTHKGKTAARIRPRWLARHQILALKYGLSSLHSGVGMLRIYPHPHRCFVVYRYPLQQIHIEVCGLVGRCLQPHLSGVTPPPRHRIF